MNYQTPKLGQVFRNHQTLPRYVKITRNQRHIVSLKLWEWLDGRVVRFTFFVTYFLTFSLPFPVSLKIAVIIHLELP